MLKKESGNHKGKNFEGEEPVQIAAITKEDADT